MLNGSDTLSPSRNVITGAIFNSKMLVSILLASAFLGASNADTEIERYYEQKGYKEIGRSVGASGISIRILKHPEQPPSKVVWLISNDPEGECVVTDDFTNKEFEVKLIDGSGDVIPYKKPEFKAGSIVRVKFLPGEMWRFEMDLNGLFHGRENDAVIVEFTWAGWYRCKASRDKEKQVPISLTLRMEQLGFESPKSAASTLPPPTVEMPQAETATLTSEHSTFPFWLAGFLGTIGLALLLWLPLRKR